MSSSLLSIFTVAFRSAEYTSETQKSLNWQTHWGEHLRPCHGNSRILRDWIQPYRNDKFVGLPTVQSLRKKSGKSSIRIGMPLPSRVNDEWRS